MSKKYGRQQYVQYTKPTTNPPAGITEIFADSSNGGKLTIFNADGTTLPLEDWMLKLAQDTKEPTGFVDRVASLNFEIGTRTFTITGSFSFYNTGVKTTKASDSIVIPDVIGMHYIYYNASNVMATSQTFPEFDAPLVAAVYWDGTKPLLMDERHGCVMDGATHRYLHSTIGTRYQSGLSALFDSVSLLVASGIIWDEDIKITIGDQSVCDVLYKNGTSNFTWNTNQSKYYHDNGTNVYYNNVNALATATNTQYVAYWIFATNSITRPIVSVMGQRVDSTLANARANNTFESLSFTNFPFQEMKLLYRVIIRGNKVYQEAQDLRSISNAPSGTYVATDHNALTGRSNPNVHPASSIDNTPTGDISSVTVQDAINELDLETFDSRLESFTRSGLDSYDLYTVISFYDANGVLRKTSTLSGGTSPLYTTRTVLRYDASSQLISTKVYTLTYDANEDIVSETLV